MSHPQTHPTRFPVQEYLRMELHAEQKHEYRDGEIIAIGGGPYEHSLIIANVIGGWATG